MAKKVRPTRHTIRFQCVTWDPWPIVVAGNLQELGNWNPDVALPLQLQTETGGRREWAASVTLTSACAFEYKFIAKTDGGVIWEMGDNRHYWPDATHPDIAEEFRK